MLFYLLLGKFPWNPGIEEQSGVLMVGGDCLYFCIWCLSEIKAGSWSWIFDTDEHDIWIADFLAGDREIPSRKVLHSQKMVPEFPGPWSTHHG